MSTIQYLREQAAKADRLARAVMDSLTISRLQAMSRDYESQADQFAAYFKPTAPRPN
jgi:hypothetical protein